MDVKCPKCGRWLSEMAAVAGGFNRSVCRDCGVEVAVLVKEKGLTGNRASV